MINLMVFPLIGGVNVALKLTISVLSPVTSKAVRQVLLINCREACGAAFEGGAPEKSAVIV